jgi:hypothetical protein
MASQLDTNLSFSLSERLIIAAHRHHYLSTPQAQAQAKHKVADKIIALILNVNHSSPRNFFMLYNVQARRLYSSAIGLTSDDR